MSPNMGIPRSGLTMVKATITEWKEPEGASVGKDQPIPVIEMEKTSYGLGAIASGIRHIITPRVRLFPWVM